MAQERRIQEVNGGYQHVATPLEKVDFEKVRKQQAESPMGKFMAQGMTEKEALIAWINM